MVEIRPEQIHILKCMTEESMFVIKWSDVRSIYVMHSRICLKAGPLKLKFWFEFESHDLAKKVGQNLVKFGYAEATTSSWKSYLKIDFEVKLVPRLEDIERYLNNGQESGL